MSRCVLSFPLCCAVALTGCSGVRTAQSGASREGRLPSHRQPAAAAGQHSGRRRKRRRTLHRAEEGTPLCTAAPRSTVSHSLSLPMGPTAAHHASLRCTVLYHQLLHSTASGQGERQEHTADTTQQRAASLHTPRSPRSRASRRRDDDAAHLRLLVSTRKPRGWSSSCSRRRTESFATLGSLCDVCFGFRLRSGSWGD